VIGFVDTWGWLELEDRRAPRHSAVRRTYRLWRREGWRVATSNFVLEETLTLLFLRRPFLEAKRFAEGILESAERGFLTVESITPNRFREAWYLRLRYDDQPRISFTDLTSFVVMRELGVAHALTQDPHFALAGFTRVPL